MHFSRAASAQAIYFSCQDRPTYMVDHVWSCWIIFIMLIQTESRLIMFDHVWKCLKMFENVGKCWKMFDHVWSCLICWLRINLKFVNLGRCPPLGYDYLSWFKVHPRTLNFFRKKLQDPDEFAHLFASNVSPRLSEILIDGEENIQYCNNLQ